jgi:hypothetical protein
MKQALRLALAPPEATTRVPHRTWRHIGAARRSVSAARTRCMP